MQSLVEGGDGGSAEDSPEMVAHVFCCSPANPTPIKFPANWLMCEYCDIQFAYRNHNMPHLRCSNAAAADALSTNYYHNIRCLCKLFRQSMVQFIFGRAVKKNNRERRNNYADKISPNIHISPKCVLQLCIIFANICKCKCA